MKKKAMRRSLALATLLPFGAIQTWAQTAPTPEAAQPPAPADDEVVVLDPFTVTTEHEGYQAVDTLGGARIRTKLADTASSLTVVTSKLMQDLGVNNAQDLLVYTNNTEVAGLNGNFSGMSSNGFGVSGAAESRRLANPAGTTRSRGLSAMDNTRNYLLSEIPWDGYNISRVDISRGANSFLFGVGSPSGIANASTNDAMFKNQGSVEVHYGSFGTTRESLDYNRELLPSELAIRVDLLNDETRYQQDPAFSHSKRVYGALRYDPSFLSTDSSHTKIQFNIENGRVDSNNPRTLPPLDFFSGYFAAGMNQAGYDPFNYTQNTDTAAYDSTKSPWAYNGNAMHYVWGNNSAYYYDARTGTLLKATQGGAGTPISSPANVGFLGANNASNNYHLYTTGLAQYAVNADYAWLQAHGGNDDDSPYRGAFSRTVTYLNKTMTDDSVFDFYNKLIDGPNKREWQRWNTYTANLTQSLFNERFVIQGIVNREEYRRGQEGLMLSYVAPYISVDLDANLLTYPSWQTAQASANPNVGRPFIGGDTGGGGNTESRFVRDNYQLTASYSLRADDLMEKGTLSRILGFHDLTVLGGKYKTRQENRSWMLAANDLDFGVGTGLGSTLSNRGISWVAYLGDSLRDRTSAAGADLSNIANRLVPATGPVTVFNPTWTASVDPTAAWINPAPTGDRTLTQANNPANYAGYQGVPATVLSADRDIDQLYTGGDKREEILTSTAFMYQGHLWDDTIIPSFGWRKDRVRQRGTTATMDATTEVVPMNYDITDPGVVTDVTSKSYGVALHLPKFIKKNLPEGTDVSFYYFHGSNQTPRIRYSFDGTQLPNEKGETDDYSIQIDALKGRATLRLTYFETTDSNAQMSSSSPLGSRSWLIDSLPSWVLGFGASGVLAANTPAADMPANLQGVSWLWGWAQSVDHPEYRDLANQIGAAIREEYPKYFPQEFWDQYGLPVDMAAVAAGDWAHVMSNGAAPTPFSLSNSHLIHGTSPILDVNMESKGWELEATVRPLSNLELTFNASRVSAQQVSLGAAADRYLNNLARIFLDTPVGLTPQWGSVTSPVRNEFISGLWAPYLTQINLNGAEVPELRKWNFKFIGNYRFDQGFLKGANVGGAFRWASAPIAGYGIKKDTFLGSEAWVFDTNQPLRGDSDSHYDLWVGYEHKLTEKIDWRVQLNLRNVGEQPHLVTVSKEPDGSIAQQRIENGMTYDLSLKFMF